MTTAETIEIEGIVIDNNDDNSNYRITLTREDGKMVTILVPKGAVNGGDDIWNDDAENCLLYTSPSPRDLSTSRMPSSA